MYEPEVGDYVKWHHPHDGSIDQGWVYFISSLIFTVILFPFFPSSIDTFTDELPKSIPKK